MDQDQVLSIQVRLSPNLDTTGDVIKMIERLMDEYCRLGMVVEVHRNGSIYDYIFNLKASGDVVCPRCW